jgi:serine/threonine protein kinase/Tfp pilus assembly protein PilF
MSAHSKALGFSIIRVHSCRLVVEKARQGMKQFGIFDSVLIEADVIACEQCGSTSRVGRGLCLNCLLRRAISEIERRETLETVLDEIDIPDSDWRIGNYQVLERIGRGGMGVIYRARQRHSRRIVALKRILGFHADSPETLARFRREAEAAASLDHPNILPIHEVGESEDGLPFFSMKFAAGGSLLHAAPTLRNELRRSVALMAKVARAVHYAHVQGVLHRDLKPGNILLDGRGEPLVSDFGLAKWLDTSSDLTRTLTIFGTPGYIAPEQARRSGTNLTPAADVYSLGAILFELFVGRTPFLGEHALAVIQQAAEKSAPKLRSLLPGFDRDLETICAKCLERDPQARYQSAADLAEDLDRWLEGRPIIARPVLPPVRMWRWSKRNPTLAAATIAALVFATAAMFLSLVQKTSPLPPAPLNKSIAVLPFQNLSDKENIYFTQGIQDEILTDLATVAELKVISRTSVMQYEPGISHDARAISQTLGVNYLVEGSVQRASGKVRVNAQLVNARNDAHVWARTYDGDLADVFAIQSQIAKAIAGALQTKLSPREKAAIEQSPTIDLAAFDLYSHAKALNLSMTYTAAHRQVLLEAADLLSQAVARDPSFFQAHCQLVDAHTELYLLGIDRSPERLALAQKALDAAFRLQPDAGEAHLARAIYLYRIHLDYGGALRELQSARETLPNSPGVFELAGYIRRRQGDVEDSLQNLKRALELDPRNTRILDQIAISYYEMRRYSDVITMIDRVLAIKPDDIETQAGRASIELEWKADTRPMHQMVDSIRANNPAELSTIADIWLMAALADRNSTDAEAALVALGDGIFGTNWVQLNHKFGEGLIARMTNDEPRARAAFMAARVAQEKVVKAEPDFGPAWCALGLIDAGLGKKEEALREGRHAIELLPISKDSINGAHMVEYFAIIAAWVGEKGLACEQLEETRRNFGGWLVSYGELKLSPVWDPLRGDPRFEKIVTSLAPKEL